MSSIIFLAGGIISGIHVYTYGCWLRKQGQIAGFILTVIVAAAAVALPAWHMYKVLFQAF